MPDPDSLDMSDRTEARGRPAAVCVSIYLGTVVGFGALMAQLVRVVGG